MGEAESDRPLHERLSAGSSSAAESVDRRYRGQLCDLVSREMGHRFARREDPEDVVQSVLRSFFRGVSENRFHIDSSAAIWKLLEEITRHKILKHVERYGAKKREISREVYNGGDQLLDHVPTPSEAAQAADIIEQILNGLESPDPEIFRLRLEGFNMAEIAERVGCTRAAVRSKLDRMQNRMEKLLADYSKR